MCGARAGPAAGTVYKYPMTHARRRLGDWGENIALKFLLNKGYRLVARNVRTRYGEIDLIVRRGDRIIFVEIKTRSSTGFGHPEESVNPAKQQKIIASAEAYLGAHPDLDGDWQIDVISILQTPGLLPQVTHFEDAVTG